VEDRYAIETMRYVACISVQEKDCPTRIVGIDVPAVKRETVGGFEIDIDIVKACVPWRCLKFTAWQACKEHTQQHITAGSYRNQRSNRPHGTSCTGIELLVWHLLYTGASTATLGRVRLVHSLHQAFRTHMITHLITEIVNAGKEIAHHNDPQILAMGGEANVLTVVDNGSENP